MLAASGQGSQVENCSGLSDHQHGHDHSGEPASQDVSSLAQIHCSGHSASPFGKPPERQGQQLPCALQEHEPQDVGSGASATSVLQFGKLSIGLTKFWLTESFRPYDGDEVATRPNCMTGVKEMRVLKSHAATLESLLVEDACPEFVITLTPGITTHLYCLEKLHLEQKIKDLSDIKVHFRDQDIPKLFNAGHSYKSIYLDISARAAYPVVDANSFSKLNAEVSAGLDLRSKTYRPWAAYADETSEIPGCLGDPQMECLDLTLKSGLAALGTVRKMRNLNLTGVRHDMDKEDVQWMVDCWPELETVTGVDCWSFDGRA
ncbi:MAG: hypothetical protein BYD32DRAFT_438203 [Podila humilis]|nr:MAG: hypothetical protein BYD32DRAFT_438203 [Podila humilis]